MGIQQKGSIAIALAFIAITTPLFAAGNGIDSTGMSNCDDIVEGFMSDYGIPGASLAIAKEGRLIFMRSYGDADLGGAEPLQPHHRIRVASNSKPITAIAIMKLVEQGLLTLDDPAFGVGGILENHPLLSQANVTDPRIFDITVRNLLDHSTGWQRDSDCFPDPTSPYSSFYGGCSPVQVPLHTTAVFGAPNPVKEPVLIRFLMEQGVNFDPGSGYNYSNVGYLVLGQIIETLSGQSYEEYVRNEILSPIGVCDMQLGRNLLEDKSEREAEYDSQGYTQLSLYGDGTTVPIEYGGRSIEAMSAHGGWIATPRDLTRLLSAVDDFPTKPDILTSESLATMTSPSANASGQGLGWFLSGNDWWHNGLVYGSSGAMRRTGGEYNWAFLLNSQSFDGNYFTDLYDVPVDCINSGTSLPTWDLMDVPTENASNLGFSSPSTTSVELNWQAGNGTGRMLVGKAGGPVDAFPLDGSTYQADSVWGGGSDLGGGNFVLSIGDTTNAVISGLQPGERYYFRLFEFNRSGNTGLNALFMLCDSNENDITLGVGPGEVNGLRIRKSPSSPGQLRLTWGESCINPIYGTFAIYEGTLGNWMSHQPINCGATGVTPAFTEITPGNGSRYYLVVPQGGAAEGSYGRQSDGLERPQPPSSCLDAQALNVCP